MSNINGNFRIKKTVFENIGKDLRVKIREII